LASLIFGLYSGLIYFTPVFGGLIADRWIGQRSAVVLGAVLMSAGHLAMAFDQSFLLALALLIVGCGFLKGNISAQVGSLYAASDEFRRVRGYAIFSIGINVGAMLGPLVCGYLAQQYGWHTGFGAAAAFILIGLVTYLIGYRHLPARVERKKEEARQLTRAEWTRIGVICAVLVIELFPMIGYFQSYNTVFVWIQDHVTLDVFGFLVPIPWFNSVDPVFSILGVPFVFAIWAWQAKRGGEPHDLDKIGAGAWLVAAANLILVAAILVFGNDQLSPLWPFLYFALLGFAFLFHWPTTLALVSRAAPASVNSTMMGVAFLVLFAASFAIGWLGGFYERMAPVMFWAMHAAIAAVGGVAVLIFGGPLSRALKT
jgi:POT family proton-dependent oligopeptide transporter